MMPSRYGEVSGVQAEKIQKLRVNRVAIIQTLRVEHVLPYLLGKNILSDDETIQINAAKTVQDKVRKLIDILPSKGRLVNWYGAFCEALKCPDTRSNEYKKKYAILLEFLDNTILPKRIESEDANLKLPHYEPLPSITNLTTHTGHNEVEINSNQEDKVLSPQHEKGEIDRRDSEKDDEYKKRRTLLKGLFHKWIPAPDAFSSLIPDQDFSSLENSEDLEDKKQLEQELESLKRIRNLEVVIALSKQDKLPADFEICMSSAAEQILTDSHLHHLYFKYFEFLKQEHCINVPEYLTYSFLNLLKLLENAEDEEIRENMVKLAFGVFDLLKNYGMYNEAEKVILSVVVHLSNTVEIGTWLVTYRAFVKLMSIRNQNIKFTDADAVYNAAQQVARKIELMSFGQDLLDQVRLHLELSILMREQGSIGSSHAWALEALKDAKFEDPQDIVDVLCNASLSFGNKLLVKRAEELAVYAVKYARSQFATRHPTYVQALINFCHYSNEYRQDDMSIQVARRALETCHKIYGAIPNLQTALSHLVLARALVVNYQFTDEEYYGHAIKAWEMATRILPGSHPKLALFRLNLAQCLQWKSTHCDPSEKLGILTWAETECLGALARFRAYWGEFSLKTGQAYSLLGQIYTKMHRLEEAETKLKENVTLHKLSVPGNSHFLFLSKASLGAFYKSVDKPLEGLELLLSVVDNIDCGGTYLSWVHVCYDTVIDILNAVGQEDDAEHYQAMLIDWMKKNPKPSHQLTWLHLHADPEPYQNFLHEFAKSGAWSKITIIQSEN